MHLHLHYGFPTIDQLRATLPADGTPINEEFVTGGLGWEHVDLGLRCLFNFLTQQGFSARKFMTEDPEIVGRAFISFCAWMVDLDFEKFAILPGPATFRLDLLLHNF
jgi:hypothetical protein